MTAKWISFLICFFLSTRRSISVQRWTDNTSGKWSASTSLAAFARLLPRVDAPTTSTPRSATRRNSCKANVPKRPGRRWQCSRPPVGGCQHDCVWVCLCMRLSPASVCQAFCFPVRLPVREIACWSRFLTWARTGAKPLRVNIARKASTRTLIKLSHFTFTFAVSDSSVVAWRFHNLFLFVVAIIATFILFIIITILVLIFYCNWFSFHHSQYLLFYQNRRHYYYH